MTADEIILSTGRLVRKLARFKHVESDDTACQVCGDPFDLREGSESTGFCDPCAQKILNDVILKAKEIKRATTTPT